MQHYHISIIVFVVVVVQKNCINCIVIIEKKRGSKYVFDIIRYTFDLLSKANTHSHRYSKVNEGNFKYTNKHKK